MSEINVGTAYALAQLRYDTFTQGVNAVLAQVERLRKEFAQPLVLPVGGGAGGAGGAGAPRAPTAASPNANALALTRQTAALEAQQARLARVQGDVARAAQLEAQAEQRLNTVLADQSTTTIQAVGVQRQLTTVQTQAARASQQGASLAGEFGSSLKSNLLGIIGPAALATAALGALRATAQSFKDAFDFKVQLDASTRAIEGQVAGVRDSGQVFREAAGFANQYKLTQQETNAILSNSTDILRASSSSVSALEANLLRLQSRDVSKPVSEAARAVRELQAGDVTSIKELFNVPAREALRMKNEIAGGADAVKVLGDYLDRAGVGMDVLERRTEGTQGALNDAAIAAERLQLAQARFAEGPGVAIVNAKTQTLLGITANLEGNYQALNDANDAFLTKLSQSGSLTEAFAARQEVLNAGLQQNVGAIASITSGLNAQALAVVQVATKQTTAAEQSAIAIRTQADAIGQSAQQSVLDTAKKDAQANVNALLTAQTQQAASAFLALNPGITESGIAAEVAAGRVPALVGQLAALQVQANAAAGELFRLQQAQAVAAAGGGARRPGRELQEGAGIGGAARAFADNMTKGSDAAQTFLAEQQRIAAAQQQLDLARARTSGQRIAILQRELAGTTDQADRLRILAQIEGERNSGAKAHTGELNKQLSLEERIRDSKEAQLKAALDATEAAIRDRQEKRKEDQEARAAQRILASGRASQQFKDAAADALALIAVHQQQRQLDIQNKLATAGGAVINGRVYQSRVGEGLPNLAAPTSAGAAPAGVGAAAAVPPISVGAPVVDVKVYVDGQEIAARVVLDASQGFRASRTAGGGRQP